jgi:hypothetical protein
MGSTLDGVTTACVLFLFTCLVIPNFIKNRTQYYAAFGCIIGIILMNTLALMVGSDRFRAFAGVIIGFLQLVSVMTLVLCAGGMNIKTLAGEMRGAYEVIRRGEEEKQVIVPLSGEMPKARSRASDEAPPRINIETPAAPPPPSSPPDSQLPME